MNRCSLRRVGLAGLTIASLLLLAACGSDGGDDETTTTTAEVTTTTAAPTTTTVIPSPTTTSQSAPTTVTTAAGGLPTDPQAYATAFVEAWATGDQATASILGTESAVNAIFAFEGGGTWTVTSCEGAAGSTFCTYTAGGDPTVVVQVGNEAASQGQEHAVTGVTVDS
jgi:hypothetical protein